MTVLNWTAEVHATYTQERGTYHYVEIMLSGHRIFTYDCGGYVEYPETAIDNAVDAFVKKLVG